MKKSKPNQLLLQLPSLQLPSLQLPSLLLPSLQLPLLQFLLLQFLLPQSLRTLSKKLIKTPPLLVKLQSSLTLIPPSNHHLCRTKNGPNLRNKETSLTKSFISSQFSSSPHSDFFTSTTKWIRKNNKKKQDNKEKKVLFLERSIRPPTSISLVDKEKLLSTSLIKALTHSTQQLLGRIQISTKHESVIYYCK